MEDWRRCWRLSGSKIGDDIGDSVAGRLGMKMTMETWRLWTGDDNGDLVAAD